MSRTEPVEQQAYCTLAVAPTSDLQWEEVILADKTAMVDLQNVKLKSIPMARPDPVKIVDDKIRIDE